MISKKRDIVTALVELAGALIDDFDVVDFCQQLCMDGADLLDMGAAGVMLRNADGHLEVFAASSEEVGTLELFQIQRDAGPCIESFRSGQMVHSDSPTDLIRRWPNLGRNVAEHYAAVYAFPMRWQGSMLGALGLYGEAQGSLHRDHIPLGQALADIATISLLQNEALREATVRSEQLQGALNSRVVIEQAKGKFAERHGVSIGEAFNALRRYAQNNNMKLVAVAAAFTNDDLAI